MLAAVNFGLWPVLLFHIAAGLLFDIGAVIPALEMSGADLALGIFFIAGTLTGLLYFYLVVWKLGWSAFRRLCGGGQCSPREFILNEGFCGRPEARET